MGEPTEISDADLDRLWRSRVQGQHASESAEITAERSGDSELAGDNIYPVTPGGEPSSALAAIRADLPNACVPDPETLRVIRAVPKLLAIAEAAAAALDQCDSLERGERWWYRLRDTLASLTSEETPEAECPRSRDPDLPIGHHHQQRLDP